MEILLLVLIPLVVIFGVGVLLVSRARGGVRFPPLPRPPGDRPAAPPVEVPPERIEEIEDILAPVETAPVEEAPVEEAVEEAVEEVAAPPALEPEELVRPRFRDRL